MALQVVPDPENEPMVPKRMLDAALVDLENAQADLCVKRRQITTLRKQLAEKVLAEENMELAEPVIDYWRWKLNHARARSSVERVQVVIARLKAEPPHTREELLQAIDGCALRPFVTNTGRSYTGKVSQRHDGMQLIFKSEENMDRFMTYRVASIKEDPLSVVLRVLCLPRGTSQLPFDKAEEGWRAMCPVCRVGWDQGALLLLITAHYVGCDSCVGLSHDRLREALL